MAEDDLSELIAQARKRPLNFGLCMGKKPEGTVFLLHKRRDAAMLARKAKQEGETAKVASGVAEAQGRKLTLKCLDDPPSGLARRLKVYLKSVGLRMTIIIADENGNPIEEADDEEEEAAAAGANGDLVRKRGFMITRWKQIPVDLRVHVSGLKTTITDNLDYEDADEIGKAMEIHFAKMILDMRDQIDTAFTESVSTGDGTYAAVGSAVKNLKQQISKDELIAVLKKGDLIPGQPFEDAFLNALDEVNTVLTT